MSINVVSKTMKGGRGGGEKTDMVHLIAHSWARLTDAFKGLQYGKRVPDILGISSSRPQWETCPMNISQDPQFAGCLVPKRRLTLSKITKLCVVLATYTNPDCRENTDTAPPAASSWWEHDFVRSSFRPPLFHGNAGASTLTALDGKQEQPFKGRRKEANVR